MAFQLKPKEEKFFALLEKHAELGAQAGDVLYACFAGNISAQEGLETVRGLKKEGAAIRAKTMARLQKTFITPIDREDIQAVIEQLDGTLDQIKEIMDKMSMYNPGTPTAGAVAMAQIVAKCMQEIRKSVSYMRNLKDNYVKIEARSEKVSNMESQGDVYYHEEMARLFTECTDPIHIIKWKEILSAMENVMDDCEVLVNLFQRVVLKYA